MPTSQTVTVQRNALEIALRLIEQEKKPQTQEEMTALDNLKASLGGNTILTD